MGLATIDLPGAEGSAVHADGPGGAARRRAASSTIIRERDLLVHHPFDSFTASVERFIEEAADDDQVLAIKLTLYRTSGDTALVAALVEAAQRGKQVAVIVELKARFDEANNIIWARQLEDAGVHVAFGSATLKTHAKTALVVRRESDGIRRYVHLGSGNYNSRTARLYTDVGLFTCSRSIGADVSDLFNSLTGYSRQRLYRKLLVAPVNLRNRFIELIEREAAHAAAGRPARIICKMNALVDAEVIDALYRASQAGVEIDLIVRGICCLRPGLPGISERINVISIIGRFLEHSRFWHFANGGSEEFYIGSADWMPRNFDRRVEAVAPVDSPALHERLRSLLASISRTTARRGSSVPTECGSVVLRAAPSAHHTKCCNAIRGACCENRRPRAARPGIRRGLRATNNNCILRLGHRGYSAPSMVQATLKEICC